MGAGIELIQEQAIGITPGDHAGRTETAGAIDDLRHPDEIFWRYLSPEQGDAWQPYLRGKLLDQGRLTNTWRSPNKHRAHDGDVE